MLNKALLYSTFAFVAISSIFIVFEMYWILLIPIALLVIYMAFFKLNYLIYFIVFSTPLAINIEHINGGFSLSVPTEPLLFGITLLFFFRLLYAGYNKKIISHPVSIALLFNLGWIFLTMLTSTEPIVSLKFLVARLWFVIPMYFIGVLIFEKKENAIRFLWLYFIALCIIVVYTLTRHVANGMSEHSSHWVMEPFYRDHTSYGAILALFIPIIIGLSSLKYKTKIVNYLAFALFGLALAGIIFSYTRAAWLGVFAILILYFVILLKIKFKTILISGFVVLGLGLSMKNQIVQKLEKNRQHSSTDLAQHVQSISNISNDASNLERLNRWSCAYRMFKDKPFFGWGPGTYQMKYAPYQLKSEKTILSTNSGNMGNAHNEYIGPLAESGVFGFLSVCFVFGAIIYTGLRVYHRAKDREIRTISLVIVLGLITYMIHGMMNNFLDTDKASVPLWGMVAILVAFDLKYCNSKENEKIETKNEG